LVLLFLQQPATHSAERGLEEEKLVEWTEFKSGVFIFYRTKCRMGLQAVGLAVCHYKFLVRWPDMALRQRILSFGTCKSRR
jgi:hypothetical protein